MTKEKHDIHELLSMLPEADVVFWHQGNDYILIYDYGNLKLEIYAHRLALALACYCREVSKRIAGEYGKMCDGYNFDDMFFQSYRAMHKLGDEFMEWAEQ